MARLRERNHGAHSVPYRTFPSSTRSGGAPLITVVAALIERDGKLLVCQRRCDAAFPLQWEFPGGKIHLGESPQEALARELREELSVTAAIGREVYRTRHRYRELADELELIFFAVSLPGGAEVRNLAFEQIAWAAPAALPSYDFLPADRELVAKLGVGEIKLQP